MFLLLADLWMLGFLRLQLLLPYLWLCASAARAASECCSSGSVRPSSSQWVRDHPGFWRLYGSRGVHCNLKHSDACRGSEVCHDRRAYTSHWVKDCHGPRTCHRKQDSQGTCCRHDTHGLEVSSYSLGGRNCQEASWSLWRQASLSSWRIHGRVRNRSAHKSLREHHRDESGWRVRRPHDVSPLRGRSWYSRPRVPRPRSIPLT